LKGVWLGLMPGFSELRKNFWKRLKIALCFIIVFILVDEGIKEGYLFKLSDVLIPLTHENTIIIIGAVLLIVVVIKRRD